MCCTVHNQRDYCSMCDVVHLLLNSWCGLSGLKAAVVLLQSVWTRVEMLQHVNLEKLEVIIDSDINNNIL